MHDIKTILANCRWDFLVSVRPTLATLTPNGREVHIGDYRHFNSRCNIQPHQVGGIRRRLSEPIYTKATLPPKFLICTPVYTVDDIFRSCVHNIQITASLSHGGIFYIISPDGHSFRAIFQCSVKHTSARNYHIPELKPRTKASYQSTGLGISFCQ